MATTRIIKKRLTNTAFVELLMTHSKFGALAGLFVMDALDKWSKVIAEQPQDVDSARQRRGVGRRG